MAKGQLTKKEEVNGELVLRELCKKFSIDYAQFANVWTEKYLWQRRLWNYKDTLGFNQRVCRDVTNTILSEPVRIWTKFDDINNLIQKEIKKRLSLDSVLSKHLAHCMGIGDMVMTVYIDPFDGAPAINYIPGYNVIPMTFNHHSVKELAWFTTTRNDDKTYIIATVERLTGRETFLFEYTAMALIPINYGSPLWPRILGGVKPSYNYSEVSSQYPKFAWISTGLNNARWIDTPFHNSFIWPIKYIDTINRDWTLLDKEYENSVKRIFLSPELVKRTYDVTDSNGNAIPMKKINPNDSLFECVDMNEEKVKEWAPQVRFTEYAEKLKFDLKCWGMAVGLGAEFYDIDKMGQPAATATQVLLTHREAFNTINNIKYNLETALQTVTYAMIEYWVMQGLIPEQELAELGGPGGINIHFDDGVFVNRAAKVQEGINLYLTKGPDGSSAIDKFTLLTVYCGYDDDSALKISSLSQQELMNGLMLQAQMMATTQPAKEEKDESKK